MGAGQSSCLSSKGIESFSAEGETSAGRSALSFPEFNLLSDDIVIEILSFVAYAPFEPAAGTLESNLTNAILQTSKANRAPLTHVLPLVCKKFRDLCCTSDVLWMASLQRLVLQEPGRCEGGLRHLSSPARIDVSFEQNKLIHFQEKTLNHLSDDEMKHYLSLVCKEVCHREANRTEMGHDAKHSRSKRWARNRKKIEQSGPPQDLSPVRTTYMLLVRDHMLCSLPVFYMPMGNIRLFRMIGLHFFEPRYCLLIREATAGRTEHELRGSRLSKPRPRFIFAAGRVPLASGTPAFLVEVHRVRIYASGRADVLIMPIKRIRMVRIAERPLAHGLFDASFKPITESVA